MKIKNYICILLINIVFSLSLSSTSNMDTIKSFNNKKRNDFITDLSFDLVINRDLNNNSLNKDTIDKYKNKYGLVNINTKMLFNLLLESIHYRDALNFKYLEEKNIKNNAIVSLFNLQKRKFRETEELHTSKKKKLNSIEIIEIRDDNTDYNEDVQKENQITIQDIMKNIIKDINPNIKDDDIIIIINIIKSFNDNLTTLIEKTEKKTIMAFFKNPNKYYAIRQDKINKNLDFVIPAQQSTTIRFLDTKVNLQWSEEDLYKFAQEHQNIFKKLLVSHI